MGNEKSLSDQKRDIADAFFKAKESFSVLGDESRIKIICLLLSSESGELNVEEITSNVFLSRPAVSHHLKLLIDSGILKSRRVSRFNYYSINRDTKIWEELCRFFSDVGRLIASSKQSEHGPNP